MISSGYFQVSEAILRKLSSPDRQREFLWEMFTYGGRIGFDEYNRWILWVLEQEKGKAA